ncbi:uncharacterized protein EV154DRAFT_426860 [Mucor mucedo]|uniref:uncharacterized protein n=1 Tax=Mucor mucedo TaxID=29922 RepID=UPI00221EAD09|nr:uncharacterized protein EV154DRAFT_426860 [Mucor mucedo]KAI7887754.1 hypothetical protein EV154DRAFT_426860 [Mucor mucedo]
MVKPSATEAYKRKKTNRFSSTNQQPRWHNQAYMLYLALRQHTEKTMARTDLIKSALANDKRISEERLVPKVFRGKTPMNSASAILTNNSDRYFIPFKPDGSKSMHFRLSFEPGSFESAFKEYNEWQANLVQHDWPYCFGSQKKPKLDFVKELEIMQTYPTEFDEFLANRKRQRNLTKSESMVVKKTKKEEHKDEQGTPRQWQDIIALKKSTASANDNYHYYNNNNYYGLFASRPLPHNIPLGYYFGVPMTEDEFDSMKDGIGQASEYSYMYQKTVIDPTDKNGRIYYHDGAPLCPFHYIKETTIREKVNVAFYEGEIKNQIVCWTKKDISPGDELFAFYHNHDLIPSPPHTSSSHMPDHSPEPICQTPTDTPATAAAAVSPLLSPPLTHLPPMLSRHQDANNEYWQKKPSISSMLNTTIPIL